MNLLAPDDVLHNGVRRKSLCNGAIMAAANGTMPKKKDRGRRGSLSEPPCRRASLVQRYTMPHSQNTHVCTKNKKLYAIYHILVKILALQNIYLFLVKIQM